MLILAKKDGPLVFKAPPMLQGILLDFWQRPIPLNDGKFQGDFGLPGTDAGKGGKFLLLPAGYQGNIPEGYYVYRSGTNNVFIFLSGFYQDPNKLKPAVELIERAKIYPRNGKATAKPMVFPDAFGVPVNMLPIAEGTNLAESDSLGILASIGIIKGQPFCARCKDARDSRSDRDDGIQDQPRCWFRGGLESGFSQGLFRPPLGKSLRQRNAGRPTQNFGSFLEGCCRRMPRPPCTPLVFHESSIELRTKQPITTDRIPRMIFTRSSRLLHVHP